MDMSALCQSRPNALRQKDHLVGTGEQRREYLQTGLAHGWAVEGPPFRRFRRRKGVPSARIRKYQPQCSKKIDLVIAIRQPVHYGYRASL